MVTYSQEGEHGQKEQTVEGEAESKKRKYGPKKKGDMAEKEETVERGRNTVNAGMRAVITVLYLMRRLDSLHSLEAK